MLNAASRSRHLK